MHTFQVIRIIDGDTFEVNPTWHWNGTSGNRVRPTGYDAAEIGAFGGSAATAKLASLILGRSVQLGNAYRIDRGRLVCDVYFNGHDLAAYFKPRQSMLR
jgi:endonuclease YncB( thermonuclease family)